MYIYNEITFFAFVFALQSGPLEVIGWFFSADPANFSALEKSQSGIRKCSKSYEKS